jgi:cystinosin
VYSQFWPKLWGWDNREGATQHASIFARGILSGSLLGVAVVIIVVLANGKGSDTAGTNWAWLDVVRHPPHAQSIDANSEQVYSIQYVKLILTLFKYVPQAISNYRRKSTLGWSIVQQLLDTTGSVLSLVQLLIDSSLQADWSGLTGNPVKLGLAIISFCFDVTFLTQHYVLYGPVEARDERESGGTDEEFEADGEREGLLAQDCR